MSNAATLKPPFSSENQPKNRRSRKGVPNRATVLKKWLFAQMEITNPITKEKQKGTPYDEVMLALVSRARQGDIAAIREIQDTLHGKITDKLEIDVNQLDADIERELAELTARGEASPAHEAEGESVH